MDQSTRKIESPSGLDIYYRGPELDEGFLPAFFYFALSGEESLGLDPFNQPVTFLEGAPIRSFSFTLPLHGEGLKNTEAIARWAEALKSEDIIEEFLEKSLENISYLIDEGLVDPDKIAVGGLSRGGFAATHLAARDPRIGTVLGFAPMFDLSRLSEFEGVSVHSLFDEADKLVGKNVRYYIGNRDVRVGTDTCFRFIHHLTEVSYQEGHRSPPVEMIISPSIGYKGHGTSPEIFQTGAEWIASKLAS